MTDFDRDLETMIRGRVAVRTLDTVVPVLDELEARVDDRVMKQLRAGKGLTEQQAQQAWYEKAAIWQLREQLEKLANSGQSAAQRIAPRMEATHG